ncbi:MAG: hypothetical protein FD136_520 [Chitinophagaceae bacterium]|nr:MAG: hypothetical protein FD136_520 [Chitinophagaceae bacterium]
MQIIEVVDAADIQDFLNVNALMNADNPVYIRALDNEVNEVFDPLKNKHLKNGEAKRWIAKSDDGILLGRVAAFVNAKYINKGTDYKTGCLGFFDSVNDPAVANVLFDTAKQWLQSKGMESLCTGCLLIHPITKPCLKGMGFKIFTTSFTMR